MREALDIAQDVAAGLAEVSDYRPSRNDKHAFAHSAPFVMISATLVAVAAALATLQNPPSPTDVSATAPAWVSAVGGSLAFLLTFVLFLQGRRDRIKKQANAVWVTEEVTQQEDGSLLIKAHVHNESEAPIWSVEVLPRHSGGGTFGHDLKQDRPEIQPKDTQTFWEWVVPGNEIAYRERSPRLIFTDSADRRWERTGVDIARLHLLRRIIRRRREVS